MGRTPSASDIANLGTILGVWAHPDDEAYMSAGLMATAVENGQRVVVVTATKGELGTPDPDVWTPDRLGTLRSRELAASLAAIGVEEHHWLGHVDGACESVPAELGTAQVASIIDDIDPDTILTFGPDGMTGHPDHRSVSLWTDAAIDDTGSSGRLLHATTSRDFLDRHADIHDRFDVFFAGEPPWTHPDDLALELKLTPRMRAAKLAALRAQASQTGRLIGELGVDVFSNWWSTEWFADGRAAIAVAA